VAKKISDCGSRDRGGTARTLLEQLIVGDSVAKRLLGGRA
jgi:hypothetical protein